MNTRQILSCIVLAGLTAVPAFAELLNGDFEYWSDHPDAGNWAYVTTIQDDPDVGWTASGNAWFDEGYGGYVHIIGTNGDRIAVISWGDTTTAIAQNVGVSLVPGETYTFSIDIYGESAADDTSGQGAGEHWCIGIGTEEPTIQNAGYRQQNALAVAASNAVVGDQWTSGDTSDYTVLDPPDIFAGWQTRRVSYTATPEDAGKTISVFLSGGFQEVGADGDTCFDNAQLLIGPLDPNLAAQPDPANGASEVSRTPVLSWRPGALVRSHDVYFGTGLDEVSEATTATSSAQAGNTFDPGRLEFGQTYYWRVDEVSTGPGSPVFKGAVWNFTVEPFSIPIANITATASSAQGDNMGPEKTIDGSGLDELDQHSNDATDMWLSTGGAVPAWIQYEFDRAYRLHEMWVWNSNQIIEPFMGLGAKDVLVEYSVDGADWIVVEGATQFAQGSGTPEYAANTQVDLGSVLARFVRITINSGYGPVPQYGLSEVRFLAIPTYAREPQPADGDVTGSANVRLAWRAGREAVSHQVSMGTDAADLALAGTTSEAAFAASKLSFSTTYFWSVTEVNENEAVTAYAGDVWSFTTSDFETVDDFDQYDDNCNRIFFVWEDGLGHNGGTEIDDCDVAPSNGNGGGSTVGNATAPFAERKTVNIGESTQSLPLAYDNAFGPSEITRSIAGQDWTASAVQTLSIAFSGTGGNTGVLYVKINNTKIVYDQDPTDIAHSAWQAWNIDLTAVGGLQNVTSLTIGIDGASASGMLYIDDIRLYPLAGELITPADPGNAGLVAHYTFDGHANDGSGNGYDGVENGTPTYKAGVIGQALSLNGFASYVSVDSVGIGSAASRTIAGWAKADTDALGDWTNVFGFTGPNTDGQFFDIEIVGGGANTTAGHFGLHRHGWQMDITDNDEEWHHLAATFDGTTVALYGDGRLVNTAAADNVNTPGQVQIGMREGYDPFEGLIDDLRIYDIALSSEEIAWIAGKRTPMHRPF